MVGNGNSSSRGEFLPYDIMINILKRVPVKSLTRFKCVAKNWANLFKTPYFTALHLHHSAHNSPFLLLQRIPQPYHQSQPFTSSSCLIGPDFKVHDNQFIDFTSSAKIVGSCNGLLCVRHTDHTLSIRNPATREVRQVPGTLIDIKNFYYIGFGFSPIVNDYKIVRISVSEFDDEDQIVVLENVRVNRAEVYSLTSGSWKEIDASNLQTLYLISNSVTANGAMFWQATMTSDSESDLLGDPEFVVSFDIGQEMFTLLKGPPSPPAPTHSCSNILAVYNNKLAMFHHFMMGNFESSSIDLWILEDTHTCAAGKGWIKQYSVGPFSRILYALSIWRDEIVCREELPGHADEYSGVETVLSLFNPYSNELKNLPALRDEYYYVSFNYVESLVPVGNFHHEQ